MPALRKRSRTVTASESEAPTQTQTQTVSSDDQLQHKQMSDYELSREQRIRENRERMGKLGIFDLSLSLKLKPSRRSLSSNPKSPPPSLIPSGPTRRSSRLQNVAPVKYAEETHNKAERVVKNRKIVIEEGAKPEVYTEEHEKLLGNTDKTWVLFVDGVGKDGKRIYDSVQGKTCHQCRQKTLGYRTRCCNCNMVQGQFCGDCLYMRYGEHVLEALANPTWICPVCRGICNCSLCRQAKGWAPTGTLYKKISALGYKSVAHYLIQTRRSAIDVEKNEDAPNPVSDEDAPNPVSDEDASSPVSAIDVEKNEDAPNPVSDEDASNPVSAKRSLAFPDVDTNNKSHGVKENKLGSLKPLAETENDVDKIAAKRSLLFSDEQSQLKKSGGSNTRKPLASSTKPSPDSIAGRLKSRLKKP